MKRLVWTRAALAHLEQIQDYIAQDNPAAAYRLARDLTERASRFLADHPLLGRKGRAKGTRELVLPDTPYIIVYRVTDQVEILAVVHAAREWPEGFE
ncbi:type II toxin-antitoxin system RelE/ParE family toxin [Plastoroseomonas hellenica]|uniref:type II toxin-antitoxin system RelE/ParE family toxin n=1 Tax=Plastoroseomonas hellenica TaxID=2687306 RepID=UPI001BAD0533|nr:type II toxin-antitoxin system RelE/ParE family toxin [Plastoroseomonas hellenica]MBR0645351.1 type II toxin-antitoxin system RelE/ParE family toxin [Plastoroseomonas hellenica]